MHGERDGRTLSSPSPSMLNDETNKNDNNTSIPTASPHNPSTELAYLPIGCSVSAKYRGAFCSAQVKAIEKLVKLKVTLLDSGDTITISEEQIVQSISLRIGSTVTIRLASSNRRQSNDSNSHQHYSRSGLAAFIHSTTNPDEKQATIKQIIDNSLYTVVFNDGDEKSLRRSSLCLQGVRLYQTQYGQQKILEEIPTSTSPPPVTPSTDTINDNLNDIASIVAIKRPGNSEPQAFPALVLKRKALADYMWVRSFVDGREYIVHTRDDVQSYQNNNEIQNLCRITSKLATQACEKFLKYNQIPAVWQKKKKKPIKSDNKTSQSDVESTSESDSSSSESDDDDDELEEETTEEKDSFVAQLFAFMDDRDTPINNIPKVQNYDLDLHRLFKIVRMLGGYNKVTKNDQWGQVHIRMGLPDEISTENGRSIEHAYKKYLFAYEDLSKKLGSMNAPSAYFGGRTSMGSDSRRSLIRVRQQQQHEEEKNSKKINKSKQTPAPVKQRSRKSNESRPSTDSKPTSSATKKPTPKSPAIVNRKGPTKMKPSNVLSSSTSESESESGSETSDEDSTNSSSSNYKTKSKTLSSTTPPKKQQTSSVSTIPKKVNNQISTPSSSSSSKTDIKKISTNTKPISSSTNDTKQSKLTITIPIAKPKTQATNSSVVQSIKKTNLPSSTKDEKKKPSDSKPIPTKAVSSTIKKPLIPLSKIPQMTKTNAQQKQPPNEPTKTTTINKTSSSVLPFKAKTTQSQTSTNNNNNNKERSVSKPTASSSPIDARPIKAVKPNSSSTKTISQDRSASVPVKKTKPTTNEEINIKPISATSTLKIPKISSNNDSTKKPIISIDKIPKKQLPKDTIVKTPKIQDNTSTNQSNKSNTDQQIKPPVASPTRPTPSEPIKKPIVREVSPFPVTPASPSPPSPAPPPPLPPSSVLSTSSISDEPLSPAILPLPLINTQSLSYAYDDTPEVKISEAPLIFQSIISSSLIPTKELNENENLPTNPNKRSHPDEISELVYISSSISEIDEQLSPSKRTRRSISSQESFETFSSDQPSIIESISANRNTQLTYEDISVNDILLVTWGSNGIKQYPARCIEKNDEKNELFVHYTGWNSRHDEWIKLDRVIERKDSTNDNTLFQQRPRRTSQINTLRQQHLDSTNSSTGGSSSNEQLNQQQQQQQQVPSALVVDNNPSSLLIDDNEQNKTNLKTDLNQSLVLERNKNLHTDESDIDDNSQEQNEIWNHLETISSTEDDALSYSSVIHPNQSDFKLPIEEIALIRRSISTTNNENILSISTNTELESTEEHYNENKSIQDDNHIQQAIPKRRQSRVTSSTNKIVDSTSNIKVEQIEQIPPPILDILEHPHQYPLHVKEETIDSCSVIHSSFQTPISSLIIEPIAPSANILISPPATATGNRRSSVRQQKRRSLREPNSKDSSVSAKKKSKLDNGNILNTDIGSLDNINNNDQISTRSNSTEQQLTENLTIKRCRPTGRRGGKKSVNQQEYENEDYRSSSPSSVTMRQQLKDMFKHRPSRYNFLDLNNNLTGDERIAHLKDRMRECQKVFFNLKNALGKIEKQRKVFIRKQKPVINTTTTTTIIQTTTTEILTTSTCT